MTAPPFLIAAVRADFVPRGTILAGAAGPFPEERLVAPRVPK
jgi:hypothetical protein